MEFLLQSSKSEVEAILAAAPSDTERISAYLKSLFPYSTLSGASAAFTSALNITSVDNPGNKEVTDALFVVRDEIAAAIAKIMAFERFIALSNPPMEDGNNFGVTVQMMVAKYCKDTRESLEKIADGLPAYFDSRAGAFEKMPTVPSKTSSSSTSTSSSSGGKDGDEEKKSSSSSTEEKKSSGTSADRSNHVVAIDVNFYFKLNTALKTILDSYAVVIDNVTKNFDKLSAPKGTSGSNSMSMF
ncbi:hypothetical protein TrLO_g13814 [Triparma laevis f. longispina]|uniref:Proteasome activator PA28 C-terminal domain-containing protein n=1 Tax=Triparma laevis f. longispina TaxID=1714387 RepID=A0A9W7A8D8_9STRA|nr:hypothetical protein TrLO_g13814 [Triparma laevis f. longispina]